MKPRWRTEWACRREFQYLGGFERFDLWRIRDTIRVVWAEDWGFLVRNPNIRACMSNGTRPTVAEHALLLTFVTLFAPDIEVEWD